MLTKIKNFLSSIDDKFREMRFGAQDAAVIALGGYTDDEMQDVRSRNTRAAEDVGRLTAELKHISSELEVAKAKLKEAQDEAEMFKRAAMPAVTFPNAFNRVAEMVHKLAIDKGFWDASQDDGTKIALIHSELSETLEGIRHGNPPDDKIPEFSSAEAELADTIIRVMDLAQHHGWRLAEAILAKHHYNTSREHLHGKSF